MAASEYSPGRVYVSPEERERKILNELYGYAMDPTKDRSWEAAVRTGESNRQYFPQEKCLKDQLNYVSINVGLMQIVPGTKLLVLPGVLGVTYSAMATSAWSVGAYMGVGPTSDEEAQYDLIALTTLWCQGVQPIGAYHIGVKALGDANEGESFGKSVIQSLLRDGALRVGRKKFGETGGALVGAVFVETILAPLVDELWKRFSADAAVDMADEFIPLWGRFRSVEKARERVTRFYEIAEEYYDAKT